MAGKPDGEGRVIELMRFMRLNGPCRASDAVRHLGISQPAFSRLVDHARDEILVMGRYRSTTYAARRVVPSVGRSIPVYEIDETGGTRRLAILHAIQPAGFHVEAVSDGVRGGLYRDLPYFLHDLRPSGFLGRLIPRRHPDLEVPMDVRSWTADHCLAYLVRYGWNHTGNLVVGDDALGQYLAGTRDSTDAVPAEARAARYPALAEDVMAAGPAGSSAAGEQPKFLVDRAPGPVSLLVKFSPRIVDEAGRRVADLLVAESVALGIMADRGRPAARSGILAAGDRLFLEVERFDRVAGGGRRGTISLAALAAEFVGDAIGWSGPAASLAEQGLIDGPAARDVRWLECFGGLIANTDMHQGNLSFLARGTRVVGLAPAYDMLPMLYAPRDGEIQGGAFRPPTPSPSDADVFGDALDAASGFWSSVRSHPLVSAGFQAIAGANLAALRSLAPVERLLPR